MKWTESTSSAQILKKTQPEEFDIVILAAARERHLRRRFNLRRLRFGALWYAGPNAISNAIGYAKHRSRSHDVIRVYDDVGNVIRNARA
jgi:hypothetical protein